MITPSDETDVLHESSCIYLNYLGRSSREKIDLWLSLSAETTMTLGRSSFVECLGCSQLHMSGSVNPLGGKTTGADLSGSRKGKALRFSLPLF